MLSADWFRGPVRGNDSWDSAVVEIPRDGPRVPRLVVVGPEVEDVLTLAFTPEAALQAGRLLAEHSASNFAEDFPVTDLDMVWSPQGFRGVGIADQEGAVEPGQPPGRTRAS